MTLWNFNIISESKTLPPFIYDSMLEFYFLLILFNVEITNKLH